VKPAVVADVFITFISLSSQVLGQHCELDQDWCFPPSS